MRSLAERDLEAFRVTGRMEPPLVIDDMPRPPAEPWPQPPKARRVEGGAPAPINGELRPWVVTDDERMRGWRDEGKPWAWIAEQLGRSNKACQVRFCKLSTRAANPPKRPCLGCGKPFRSSGAGNRLCASCAGRSAGIGA